MLLGYLRNITEKLEGFLLTHNKIHNNTLNFNVYLYYDR
jgi:hypothetical protein